MYNSAMIWDDFLADIAGKVVRFTYGDQRHVNAVSGCKVTWIGFALFFGSMLSLCRIDVNRTVLMGRRMIPFRFVRRIAIHLTFISIQTRLWLLSRHFVIVGRWALSTCLTMSVAVRTATRRSSSLWRLEWLVRSTLMIVVMRRPCIWMSRMGPPTITIVVPCSSMVWSSSSSSTYWLVTRSYMTPVTSVWWWCRPYHFPHILHTFRRPFVRMNVFTYQTIMNINRFSF